MATAVRRQASGVGHRVPGGIGQIKPDACRLSPVAYPEYLSHFHISFHEVFLPYIRIPVRYILAAIHTKARKVTTIRAIETASCQAGTPKGILAIITIGEVSGIIEHQKERELSGFCIVPMATMSARIIGIVTGSMNCWVSVSLSTADPIAAKIEA